MLKTDDIRFKLLSPRGRRKFFVLRYKDPLTGRWNQESLRTTRRREANRLAAELIHEIEEGAFDVRTSWAGFTQRYHQDHLSSLSSDSVKQWNTVNNKIKSLLEPLYLHDVASSEAINQFQSFLRKTGIKENVHPFISEDTPRGAGLGTRSRDVAERADLSNAQAG